MSDLILTDKNFSEEVFKSQKPVLVDFWAEWCVPCQMISPILQEIVDEFGEKIKIGKIDVDKNPLISATFSIDAIPALILFKNGKIVQRFIGVQPKEIITEAVESVIEKES
ncbi:thioredoxin [Candidatus Parcubacteria bacterium]|nr:thioredoxin [Candidatus Parcubacteria bacterium]